MDSYSSPRIGTNNLFHYGPSSKLKRTVNGTLEVVLVDAKGLGDTERFSGGTDPYVVIKYKSHGRNSTVAKEYPDNTAANGYKLILDIWDKDSLTADDFTGETWIGLYLCRIYVDDLLASGVEKGKAEMHPTKYRVVA
ncbi:hypothetical protein MKX01_004658 [Papaver californicum]|nr:hypothetical protein MKX01_004658 [Papaver californicum]